MTQEGRQARHIQLEPWEVGGELLDILSRGLYSDAKDAIREYVQNGVDAGANRIIITVDGPRVVIRDDGEGMDDATIRAARRFGMSEKSPKQMVGYRGIGIYSAFGICERLVITSRRAGMEHLVGWTFYFGEMRRILEADKAAQVRQGIGLPDLLHQHTEFFVEPYRGDASDHFTVVEIGGISEEYRAQLNDASAVNDYLLSRIPVAFGPQGYGKEVNEWVRQYVKLNPVRISLRISNDPEFDVEPPIALDVFEPESQWIRAPDGTSLAFAWYTLTTTGRQLPAQNGASVSGFLLKLKGFTLGDRLTLKPLWPAVGGRTLYHHYTGEVHILESAQVYPNAARNDLEPGPGKQLFTKQAADFFEPLSRKARAMQAVARANRLMEGLDGILQLLRTRESAPDSDAFELYRETRNYLGELDSVGQEISKQIRGSRGKAKLQLDAAQQRSFDDALEHLNVAIRQLDGLAKGAQKRTERPQSQAFPSPVQPLPQVVLLQQAMTALREMAGGSQDARLTKAVAALEPAVQLHSIPRAIGVLDDLKAEGIQLHGSVEAIRKELRSLIGWSPLAPVSLEEALLQIGLSLEGDREEKLITSIDRALITGLGGRGERYEAVLRAIAEAVAGEFVT